MQNDRSSVDKFPLLRIREWFSSYAPQLLAIAIAVLIAVTMLVLLGRDPGRVASEPTGRDNSPAAIHQRILVLDGWLGSGSLPCETPGPDHVGAWTHDEIDSGIWWVSTPEEMRAAHCWLRRQGRGVRLALRAGEAVGLHTEGRQSIFIGVIEPPVEQLVEFYAAGARFARAPKNAGASWMEQARKLGMVVDISLLPESVVNQALSRYGPPLLYSWFRNARGAPNPAMIRRLGFERGGAMLLTPEGGSVEIGEMRRCLRWLSWYHCAIGGARDPRGLTVALLNSGLSEGNVARMYGHDLLRLLRNAEIWARKR